jgi:hypothetical protein
MAVMGKPTFRPLRRLANGKYRHLQDLDENIRPLLYNSRLLEIWEIPEPTENVEYSYATLKRFLSIGAVQNCRFTQAEAPTQPVCHLGHSWLGSWESRQG